MKVEEPEKKYLSHYTSKYIVSCLAISLETLTLLVPDSNSDWKSDLSTTITTTTTTTITTTTITTIALEIAGKGWEGQIGRIMSGRKVWK